MTLLQILTELICNQTNLEAGNDDLFLLALVQPRLSSRAYIIASLARSITTFSTGLKWRKIY